MPRKKTREELADEIKKLKKERKRKMQEIKILEKKLSKEIRRERTHRLCNHGADLEVYLNPEVFTDELIRKTLKEIFELPEVKAIVLKNTPPEEKEMDEKVVSPEGT